MGAGAHALNSSADSWRRCGACCLREGSSPPRRARRVTRLPKVTGLHGDYARGVDAVDDLTPTVTQAGGLRVHRVLTRAFGKFPLPLPTLNIHHGEYWRLLRSTRTMACPFRARGHIKAVSVALRAPGVPDLSESETDATRRGGCWLYVPAGWQPAPGLPSRDLRRGDLRRTLCEQAASAAARVYLVMPASRPSNPRLVTPGGASLLESTRDERRIVGPHKMVGGRQHFKELLHLHTGRVRIVLRRSAWSSTTSRK